MKQDIQQDIQRIGKMVASVNDLVRMGLMQSFTAIPNIYVVPSVLQLKDKKYMSNWCRNVLTVWKLTYSATVDDIDAVVLSVYDKDSGNMLCTYHESTGIVYS